MTDGRMRRTEKETLCLNLMQEFCLCSKISSYTFGFDGLSKSKSNTFSAVGMHDAIYGIGLIHLDFVHHNFSKKSIKNIFKFF